MIYVEFKVDKKLKGELSPKKKYTIKNASISLAKAEKFAEENNIKGKVEFSIFENNQLLFRDICLVGEGNSTNLILLVNQTLNTTFSDTPKSEKESLLNKLSLAMENDEIEVVEEKSINKLQNIFKLKRKDSIEKENPQRQEQARQAELERQEEERRKAREAELQRQEQARQAELERQEEEKRKAKEAELQRQEEARQAELERQEEERRKAREAELQRQEQARQAELERQEEEK
ncbi:hypothetical protein AB3M95_22320, partial [Metabacillus niabensis]